MENETSIHLTENQHTLPLQDHPLHTYSLGFHRVTCVEGILNPSTKRSLINLAFVKHLPDVTGCKSDLSSVQPSGSLTTCG